MKIYLYGNKKIDIFNLAESISGSFSFDPNEDTPSKLINIRAKDASWYLFETDSSKIYNGREYVKEIKLVVNSYYIITRNEKNHLIYVTDGDDNNFKEYSFSGSFNISVGGNNANAKYSCPYVNNVSFTLKYENNKLYLDFNEGFGYINNKCITKKHNLLNFGDEFELIGVRILILNSYVIVYSINNSFTFDTNLTGLYYVQLKNEEKLENFDIKDRNLYSDDDYFSKSPQLRRQIKEKEIEFSNPPEMKKNNDMPFILTIGPMITMAFTSIVMLFNPITQIVSGMSDIDKNIPMLITGVAMLSTSLVWPLITTKYKNVRQEKTNKENTDKFNKYLEEKEAELLSEYTLQSEIIKENIISLDECVQNLHKRKLNFWDKRLDQKDLLVARIGVGDEDLKVKIQFPEKGFKVEENELENKIRDIINKYKYIKDVPFSYSFYENKTTAIMGDYEKTHVFVDNILLQLLTFYSYDDLKIVLFTNFKKESNWDYIKYLRHNMSNDTSFRFFASNEENALRVSEVLRSEINGRSEMLSSSNGKSTLFKPYYLIVVDDLDVVRKSNIIDDLTEIKGNIGFSIIILENKLSKLPSLCNNFINIGNPMSGVLINSFDSQIQKYFKDEINPYNDMMGISRILANIPIDIPLSSDSTGGLPEALTFLEMLKVGTVDQINVLNRWNTNDSTSNLKAEVGVSPDGGLMYLDLHEKAHGPHGLIAGMTGSGKSEFIITWILSLSMNFSPDDVAFILIDYKGGGLAYAFENKTTGVRLPHLAGTITNLDKSEINRTLISINSEVKRRQRMFNEVRDKLGESTVDIYKYQGFYHEGKISEPLPHLFIVCDEFAELKDQQPDFMDDLISVARIGRSLGVHLILATQKPSGVVNDQIWSNTKFRVCLKVQDASDSNEMLKKPDAASLKQTGRFYLQVGYDEYFALGQSGWCGAKYYPSDSFQKTVDKSVSVIDETGYALKNVQAGTSAKKKSQEQGEQLAAILGEITKIAKENNKFTRRLWLDNIPEVITTDYVKNKYHLSHEQNSFDIVLGEYDAPELQEQHPFLYNPIKNGNTNFISLDLKETEEILNTLLYEVILNYLPSEISFYIMDYGSQNFNKFRKAPHCGGVIFADDDEGFTNLFKMLKEELRTRKKILSDLGIDYSDYVNTNPGKLPLMLVIFNNYASIGESHDELFDSLGEYLRDSERYGIVYLFTSLGLNTIREKHKQSIPFNIAFKLKDPIDYKMCFNSKEKKEPKSNYGRGVCYLDETVYEFQTAFVSESVADSNEVIAKLIDNLNNKNIDKAKMIPKLPDQVLLEDVKPKLKGLKRVPIGIEKGTLSIKSLNLESNIAKLVLCSKINKSTSFVYSFVEELKYLKQNIVVIDPIKSLGLLKSKITNYFDDNFESIIDKIINFIDSQKDSEKNTILIFNSIMSLIEKLGGNTKIIELIERCKSVINARIVVIDDVNKIKGSLYEEWFKIFDLSEGLYLGIGADGQSILKINGYSKELTNKLPDNFGYYIVDGSYSVVELIEFTRIEDDEEDE